MSPHSYEGQSGEPGEPGTDGGGHGGAGGRGGAGHQLERWKYAAGYLMIVCVSVLASWGYARSVRNDLARHDRISCEQRLVLAANQRDVITTVVTHLRLDDQDGTLAAQMQILSNDLDDLDRALREGC